jgi:hypothetical protein
LRTYKNRVLRRISGPKRKKMEGGWGILHSEGDQIEDEMGRGCSTHGKNEKCIQDFGRKTCRGET